VLFHQDLRNSATRVSKTLCHHRLIAVRHNDVHMLEALEGRRKEPALRIPESGLSGVSIVGLKS
jgi:hypothetical protein